MIRLCKVCQEEFELRRDHVGLATVCPDCSEGDVPKVMGKVAWSGKHTMHLEITADRGAAAAFNNAQRRFGAGPMSSLVTPKESTAGAESGKRGSGAELGAAFRSPLGEARSVRR